MFKKVLATASAVALSLAMVALPALPAAADEIDPSLTQTQTSDTPSDAPPSDAPPSDTPPADDPPADTPPADDPPADDPPADDPPAEDSPAEAQTFSAARNSVADEDDEGADEVLVLWEDEDQVCNDSTQEGIPGLLTGGTVDIYLHDGVDVDSVSYTFEGGSAVNVTVADHIHLDGLAPGDYVFTLIPADAEHPLSTDEIKIKIKPDHDSECQKVTICHATESDGNPYTNPTVSVESIINLPNGHKYHEDDLIPAFYYGPNGEDYFPGMPVGQGALPDCGGDPGTEVVFVNEDHDPQTCVIGEGDAPNALKGGVIQLEVEPSAGVEKIEYRVKGSNDAWIEVDLNTLTVTGLAPNTYEFKVTVAEGFEIDDATFDVTIGKYTGVDCTQLVDHPPVTPLVNVTPGTCSTEGSFELISPEPEEGLSSKTVTWYVNDVETEAGTYPLEAGEVVIVKVVANGPDYALEISPPITSTPEFTYDPISYDAPTGCVLGDLTTLALTGSSGGTTPLLWLAGFLGLLGVALVRSARRLPQQQKA